MKHSPLALRYWLRAALFLACLAPAARGAVVINEIMYHPPGDLEQLQYIELFNTGAGEVDLSGWSFSAGVKFRFSAGIKIAAGGFAVVCRDRIAFTRQYGSAFPIAGQFEGQLSHGGERLELSDPQKKVVDALKYSDAAPWPQSPDGHSSSLERICPVASGADPANWAASNPPEIETPAGTPGRVNDSFSPTLPPVVGPVSLSPPSPAPGQQATVEALVASTSGVSGVTMFWRVFTPGKTPNETAVPMTRVEGDELRGLYRAVLPPQPEGALIRYRIEATDMARARRSSPDPNDLRRAWSYSTFVNKNTANVPLAFVWHVQGTGSAQNRRNFDAPRKRLSQGNDAFIYVPAAGGEVQAFDFVQIPERDGGYKVHFLKDQTLRGMTTINIIFEQSPRWVLAEPLAYELYRLADVPAETTGHVRLTVDGAERGYHLLVEQPNKSFLARHDRDTSGNLYKLIWYGDGIIGKHKKKTNLTGNHADLLAALDGLNKPGPADCWSYIQEHFNVEEFASYFAVNMCIQNWDGFHNNYFLYHDTGGTGRWEIYPWDEDKTWGDYDGAPVKYDWYSLPLNYSMKGSQRPASLGGPSARGFIGWWREPGTVAGPMLANPQFRQRFLARLREICTTIFTEAKMFPLIDEMEKRLEKEIPLKAGLNHEDARQAMSRFRAHIQSFRNQVINRRKFILAELDKPSP